LYKKAAFALYPEKEYCLISLPTMELSVPLLDHMTKVDYRENVNIRHSLYITHRESILNNIIVRKGSDSDIENIDNLIDGMPEYASIMHQVKMAVFLTDNKDADVIDNSCIYYSLIFIYISFFFLIN